MAAKYDKATRYVAIGWGLFTGTHLSMSHPPIREKLVENLGEDRFKGVYSAVALGTFLPTTYFYARYAAGKGTIVNWTSITQSNPFVRRTGIGFKLLGAAMLGQSISTPSPVAMTSKSEEKEVDVRGINRITRHGAFTSLALLGIGNMLTRGHLGDIVYWSGYPAIWLLGCIHQDERLKASLPREFYDQTSLVPFWAILQGRNSLALAIQEFNKPALAMTFIAPLFLL